MKIEYKGYTIESDKQHFLVTGPDGMWSADSVEEAKTDIDELQEEKS